MPRYNGHMKNETKNSAHIKNMIERPESARVNVSLRFESHNPGYAGYISSIEEKIDSGRGYKGKNEERGRKPGTRVLSMTIKDDNGEDVEIFYVG